MSEIDYNSGIIKNVLKEHGYGIKVQVKDTAMDGKYYNVSLYNAYGVGFGDFKIDYCEGCFNETDVALWIRDEMMRKNPELF
jgi:hypothetical protein